MILQTQIAELTFGLMDMVYICTFVVTIAGGWFTIKNNAKRISKVEDDAAGFKKSVWDKLNEQTTKLNKIEVKIESSKSEILSKISELLSKNG